MFTVTFAKTQKQLRCPSVGDGKIVIYLDNKILFITKNK